MENFLRFTKTTLILSFSVIFVLSLYLPRQVYAEDNDCNAFYNMFDVNLTNTNVKITNEKGERVDKINIVDGLPQVCSAQKLIISVINMLLALAGSVAVLFIMLGGYWYLASGGEEESAEKGKKTLVNAVIGLVVVVMSFVIVRVVISTLQAKLPTSSSTPSSSASPSRTDNQTPPEENKTDASNCSQAGGFCKEADFFNVDLPETAQAGKDYVVTVSVNASDEDEFKQFCAGVDPKNVSLSARFEGRNRGNVKKFEKITTNGADFSEIYTASITLLALSPEAGKNVGSILVFGCDQLIASTNIVFTPASLR